MTSEKSSEISLIPINSSSDAPLYARVRVISPPKISADSFSRPTSIDFLKLPIKSLPLTRDS
mgnify:CR=1 FL=1